MRLVIQGLHIAPAQLTQLSTLAGGGQFQQINTRAYRLPVAQPDAALADGISVYCTEQKLDFAFVPDDLDLATVGLVVMDMDSTLISIECIDEVADMLGIKPQVAAITERSMRGELEFAESLRQRVALLQGLDQSALQRVYDERLQLSPGAEIMLAVLKQHGVKTMLVSGGFDFFTDRLKTRLGLDFAESNKLDIVDGKLTGKVVGTILDAQSKADWLNRISTQLGLQKNQVIAVGDGSNDLKMMAAAGYSVAYHAKPIVRAQATFALNQVGLDGVIGLLS
jgi:phosphoserine phosphatase